MTSLHQLVPYYRCIDAGGARAVAPGDAGLPHWRRDWTDHLDGFQREMEDAARSNRGDPRFEGNPVAYHPITGCDQQTRQSARLRDGSDPRAGSQGERGGAAPSTRGHPRFEATPAASPPIGGWDREPRQSARLRDGSLTVLFDRDGQDEGGDGTVPLLSAALSGTEP